MPVLRLDKLLTAAGLATRSEARGLIRCGRVLVNGGAAKAEMHINTERDAVTLDGEPVSYSARVVYMMNKPAGVLTATEDGREKTVLDLMDDIARRRGTAPAGRLDRDTEGLLILTDDGELAHRIISPSHGVVKAYEAEVASPPEPGAEAALAEGLTLGDGTKCLPARLERISETTVRLYISEGKYHQVKRMLANTGAPVVRLRRLSIGALDLDPGLAPGEYRLLSEQETQLLFTDRQHNL